jgi:nucleoside 2-deoxyribosyltransferase
VRIYFAGPLFTPYEREFIDRCAAQLRMAGFDVFVPHEHDLALDRTITAERIFAKDWAVLSEANAVLAILDGATIDDGTACEIGIFYGLMRTDESKKGIVGLVTDMRATRDAEHENDVRGLNLFVVGCIEAAGTI